MNYNITYQDIVFQAIWYKLRATRFLAFLFSIIKPLQNLNTPITISQYSSLSTYSVGDKAKYNGVNYLCRIAIGTPESFTLSKWVSLGVNDNLYDITTTIKTFLSYNSQQIYLTKFLNDKYDSSLRRITVTTSNSVTTYVYNAIESVSPVYFYNNWSSSPTYVANDRVVYTDNYIYKCILGHTNIVPGDPLYWEQESLCIYMYNKGTTIAGYDFLVNVPTGLLGTREAELTADVNKYKYGGKTWTINNI